MSRVPDIPESVTPGCLPAAGQPLPEADEKGGRVAARVWFACRIEPERSEWHQLLIEGTFFREQMTVPSLVCTLNVGDASVSTGESWMRTH